MKIKKESSECFHEDTDFIIQENTVDASTEVKTEEDLFEIPLLKPHSTFKIEEEFQKASSENEINKYCFLNTQNSGYCPDLNNINDHKVKSENYVSHNDLNFIKQEDTELKYTLPKDELLNSLVTNYCDFPTLKSDVDFLKESCSGQQYQDKKVNRYPWADGKKSNLIPQKRLGHIEKYFWKLWIACEFCGHFYIDGFGYFTHLFIHSVKKRRCSFKCKICREKFKLKQELFRHQKMHTGEKPLNCKICSKQFKKMHNFNKHLKNHTGEKLFKCEICSKILKRKKHLNEHFKIHTGEKPFKCEICTKSFTRKEHLQTHLKIHTGEKSFKCEICSKLFTQKQNLNQHLIIHTDTKPFKCELCLKPFTQNQNLKRHLKTNACEKSFKCALCPKLFSQKQKLKSHFKIHRSEKPFKCEICLKQFTQNQNLRRHLKIHTREKSFICAICSKIFSRKQNLNSHFKIHMGEKPFKCEILNDSGWA